MIQEIQLYNTLTRKKEVFEPLVPAKLGCTFVGQPFTARLTWVMHARL